MQFFNKQEDFILQELPDGFFDMDKEMFTIGKEVKSRLGDNGYLLDNYLSMVLEGINGNTLQQVIDDGGKAFSEVYHLYRKISDGKDVYDEDIRNQRLYPEMKKYYDQYLTKYKSSYTAELRTFVAIMPLAMKKQFSEGDVTYGVRGFTDTVRLRELYQEISTHAGNKLLDQLIELVKSRFIITPALNVYMQAITDYYLGFLLHRDEVTSKQLFQLILDEPCDEIQVEVDA